MALPEAGWADYLSRTEHQIPSGPILGFLGPLSSVDGAFARGRALSFRIHRGEGNPTVSALQHVTGFHATLSLASPLSSAAFSLARHRQAISRYCAKAVRVIYWPNKSAVYSLAPMPALSTGDYANEFHLIAIPE